MGVAQTKDKDKGQSVTLDLKEKPLDKWLQDAKGQLKQIERLDLSRQELADLPPQIAKLANLKFLQVYDNHLKAIPREIGTVEMLPLSAQTCDEPSVLLFDDFLVNLALPQRL
jgi:Leucine-rich repeat (LRR) protein